MFGRESIMNKNLIVLTDEYPYGRGETFIENERALWSRFDHVYICPLLFPAGSNLRTSFHCCANETLVDDVRNKLTIIEGLKAFFGSIGLGQDFREIKDGSILKQKPKETFRRLVVMERERLRTNFRVNRIYRRLRQLVNSEDQTYIYAYWMYEPGMVGVELKRILDGNCLVSRAHGYDLYEYRHKNEYIPFRKYTLDNIDRICPISEDGAGYLHKRYGGRYDQKITVERLGTIKMFDDVVGNGQPNHPIIVSCSNMVPLKRIDLIIKALAKSEDKIEWNHFGDGEQEKYLKMEAGKLPANISVSFHGRVPNCEVQRYYAEHAITAFINVSETEGIPVSIMEAQSYGIPVIATNVGGTHEIVQDGVNGLLLKIDFSDDDLLKAINTVFTNVEVFSHESRKMWNQMSNAKLNYNLFFERELGV